MNKTGIRVVAAFALAIGGCVGSGGSGGSGGGTSKLGLLLGAASVGATIAFAGVGKASGGTPINKDEPNSDIDDPRHGGVAACVAGNAEQNLRILGAFEDSMHELVVCGGMSQRFAVSFYDVLINVARGGSTRPGVFEHIGDGRYRIGDVMTVRLHLPHATAYGAAGDAIGFDVFDIESYFVGARVAINASSAGNADISVEFSAEGPGAALLGNFVDGNRMSLDFRALVATLGAVEMSQEISVDDTRGTVRVVYDVLGERAPIRQVVFADGGGAPLSILGARAENSELGQVLTITDWNMAFSGGGAATIDGSVSFEVRGGDFDYAGTFTYPHRSTPDITLACAPGGGR